MYDMQNHYEIEFDVPSRHRGAFEEWLSEDAVTWLNSDSVASFDVFQNDTGLSPEVKFVFGFETLEDWASFVNSEEHEAAMERFETFADNRKAVLWQRASVKLDGTPNRPVGDGGRSEVVERRRGPHTVITQ
jgi:antibiotic biosynthesis monooxygenase (ABM) superfamily enzyme